MGREGEICEIGVLLYQVQWLEFTLSFEKKESSDILLHGVANAWI